jgi:hypothetical protein
MAETPEGGSGRNDIALAGDGGRVEPGGPKRAGRKEFQHGEPTERSEGGEWSGPAVDRDRRRPMIASG